ncbi:MAG TPA: DUF5658 family protein [bacterium]
MPGRRHFVLIKGKRPDFFESKYVFALFVTLLLTITDGLLTIILVQKGAWEANPVMRMALSISGEFFIFLKFFLTAGGLLFLLRNGNRRVFGGLFSLEEIAAGIVLFYEGLIIYEITIYHIVR